MLQAAAAVLMGIALAGARGRGRPALPVCGEHSHHLEEKHTVQARQQIIIHCLCDEGFACNGSMCKHVHSRGDPQQQRFGWNPAHCLNCQCTHAGNTADPLSTAALTTLGPSPAVPVQLWVGQDDQPGTVPSGSTPESTGNATCVAAHGAVTSQLRILIAGMATTMSTNLYGPAIRIWQAYARRHGFGFKLYRVDPKRPPQPGNIGKKWLHKPTVTYRKLFFLRELLNDPAIQQQYDYIFWTDMDIVVMNGAVHLSCFLHHDDNSSAAGTFDFVITDKSFSINDGNFFVRVSQWSATFLRDWIDISGHHVSGWPATDNGSLMELLAQRCLVGYNGECEARLRKIGGEHPTLFRCLREWLDKQGKPYGHRICGDSNIMFFPAERGFNNHRWLSVMAEWGWKPSDAWVDNVGMFAMHTKDVRKWANVSSTRNRWQWAATDIADEAPT
jgi:hypothetical protein